MADSTVDQENFAAKRLTNGNIYMAMMNE